ncbi:MAG: manganese efflux pump MntP family protein [Deltaproteobacteria bacterium]|jgi:putative Mn2+ efflux pump MntP|nr:manganese efflux pump MntP family protein [Deltaproteobacteria bacterium]MDA8305866.1 manganese efflux pump [Deltaproteobacteria bacterium]
MMPIFGWLVSRRVPEAGRVWGPWIAFALLFFIGSKMFAGSFKRAREEQGECADPTRGVSLLVLSVAASLDALGVGFGMGLVGSSMVASAVCFGVTAGVMTWVAMKLGKRLSMNFGSWVEALGGLILIALAVEFII